MPNSADRDQEANWSGSTLFEKAGYIQAQQDKVSVSKGRSKRKPIIYQH